MMASPHDVESARLSMVEARKALEDYEALRGFVASVEHRMLIRVFTRATDNYLRLSASKSHWQAGREQ